MSAEDDKKRGSGILASARKIATETLQNTAEDVAAVVVRRAAEGAQTLVADVSARAQRGTKRSGGAGGKNKAKKRSAQSDKKTAKKSAAKKKSSKKSTARKSTKKKASRRKRM